jgi:hypothetical protein
LTNFADIVAHNHKYQQTEHTSQVKSLNTKRTIIYDGGNPDPVLEQAQQYDEAKPVNGVTTLPPLYNS